MSDVYKAPEAPLQKPVAAGQFGSVASAIEGQYELRPVELIKQAWANLDGLKAPLMIALLIYVVISIALSAAQGLALAGLPENSASTIGWSVVSQLLIMLISGPLGAGIVMISIKHSVGNTPTFSELFEHFDKTFKLFFTVLLMYLMIFIGLILLIIPGVYLMIAYSSAMPLVVEKNMGIWEAMETSRKTIGKKWFSMLGLVLLISLVIIAGILALGVGVIWAAPVGSLAYAIFYRDTFGVEPATLGQK